MSEAEKPAVEPTLTVRSETPSEAIISAGSKLLDVLVPDDGRRIQVRKFGPMQRLDLAAVLGPERMANQFISGPCGLAFSVQSINGQPEYPAGSYEELRALVGRLDETGINAIADAMDKAGWLGSDAEADKAKNS